MSSTRCRDCGVTLENDPLVCPVNVRHILEFVPASVWAKDGGGAEAEAPPLCGFCGQAVAHGEHDIECPDQSWEYLKFLAEGCDSLRGLVFILRATADDLEKQANGGWELQQPVDNGHVFMGRKREVGP